jgi:hypothetical protein
MAKWNRTKGQNNIYKAHHRSLKIAHSEHHIQPRLNSWARDEWSASYIDILLNIDNWDCLKTKDWNIAIVNFPLMRSKISTAPAYGVYQDRWEQQIAKLNYLVKRHHIYREHEIKDACKPLFAFFLCFLSSKSTHRNVDCLFRQRCSPNIVKNRAFW